MLTNYIKIAFRNLLKQKSFSIINIFGLSLGVACCLLLALFIQNEISYDKYHQRLEDLYRVTTNFHSDHGLEQMGTTSPPIGIAMAEEIPEVEASVRLVNPPGVAQNLIKYQDNLFYEKEGFIADSTVFDVLTYEFVEGDPSTALDQPNNVVINDKMAKKLFGNSSALDKVIFISQGGPSGDFKVTGVFKDNERTHVHANFFVSMSSSGWAEYLRTPDTQDEWAGQNFIRTYVKLRPQHDVQQVVKKMNDLLQKHGAEDLKALGMSKTLSLEPLQDIYLYSSINGSPRITYIYIIACIASFILILACINFMNLSTAKATKRAAEIGVRKVMGAFRSALIGQILGEAMIIVLISILLSVVMVQIALPSFNILTGKTISMDSTNVLYLATSLLVLTLITGLLAGSYPAFYISAFNPAEVLKGKFGTNKTSWLRQALVVFQFAIAITLVCGMILISRQLNFMQSKNLGFNYHSVIALPLRTATAQKSYPTLQKELEQSNTVLASSGTTFIPGTDMLFDFVIYPQGGSMEKGMLTKNNYVDYNYLDLLSMKVIAGRTFTDNRKADGETKVVINHTAAKQLGFEAEKAVGQKVFTEWQGKKYEYEIIGVIEDYHQVSLKEKITPMLFRMSPETTGFDYMLVRVRPENFKETVSHLENTWKSVVNDTPFEFSFLDENIQKQYLEDKKISSIITSFTVIAMFISCLGLYGLSSFMAERRFKEIGIRKVMGASVQQVVGLLSMEFLKLVALAFLISVPLAWYGMAKWLDGFAYRITLDFTVFAYAGIAALIVAMLTVSFESFRAASSNPVKSLRSE